MNAPSEFPNAAVLSRKLAQSQSRVADLEAALRAARAAITEGRHGDALRLIRTTLGNPEIDPKAPAPEPKGAA